MTDHALQGNADRRQLQQIIAGLTEGVILVEPDQTILWANEAALTMHGVTRVDDLGRDVTIATTMRSSMAAIRSSG